MNVTYITINLACKLAETDTGMSGSILIQECIPHFLQLNDFTISQAMVQYAVLQTVLNTVKLREVKAARY